jgi:hypothetical protein
LGLENQNKVLAAMERSIPLPVHGHHEEPVDSNDELEISESYSNALGRSLELSVRDHMHAIDAFLAATRSLSSEKLSGISLQMKKSCSSH